MVTAGAGGVRPAASVVGSAVLDAGLRLFLVRFTLVTAAWVPVTTVEPPGTPPSSRWSKETGHKHKHSRACEIHKELHG